MITVKDFKLVRIWYVNTNLTFDKTYSYTESTSTHGGCNLAKLKTRWSRFWANMSCDIDLGALTDKQYKNRIVTLTCDKQKLWEYSPENLQSIKSRILDTIRSWKLDVQDVLIYAI